MQIEMESSTLKRDVSIINGKELMSLNKKVLLAANNSLAVIAPEMKNFDVRKFYGRLLKKFFKDSEKPPKKQQLNSLMSTVFLFVDEEDF